MRVLRNIFLGFWMAAFPFAAALAEDAGAMALALSAADVQDWETARKAAAISGPMAERLVSWQTLRDGQGEFADYLKFIRENPDWPGLDLIRRKGSEKLRPDMAAADIGEWFDNGLPDTLNGEIAFLSTLEPQARKAELARFWIEIPLDANDTAAFLGDYSAELAASHLARVNHMLDTRQWRQAEAILPLLPLAERALPAARIALQARRDGVDDLILALPAQERNDPGLTMDRFLWRVQAKQHDGAQELMLAASTDAESLRNPALWTQMRVDYARLAMRNGNWSLAERLAAPHFLPTDNRHYSDLEWLAGYAALKSNAPDRALKHFLHLETVVGSAISKARAFYWQGRAYEAMGDEKAAQAAYEKGAAFPAVYYGQLSAEKTGAEMPVEYAVTGRAIETLPDWRGGDLRNNSVFQAGQWLLATGRPDQAQRFLLHLAETSQPKDIARMARMMIEARAPWHGLRLSKRAADHGEIYPAAHFPLTGLEHVYLGLPPELVLSIARQESEFNHTVTSHVGAKGLMQLMPGTARDMAAKLRMPYQAGMLTADPAYNARLGAAYLEGLRERFGPSVALTAAGYNAGPGRPIRWLKDFGDLRQGFDPVDWVELIPFDETRNYVMRVTEAMPIYRARIIGRPSPLVPTWELTGGGQLPPPPIRLTLETSARPPEKPFIGPRLPDGFIASALVANEQ